MVTKGNEVNLRRASIERTGDSNYAVMKKAILQQREDYASEQARLYIPPAPNWQNHPKRIAQLKEIQKKEDWLNQIRAKVPNLSKADQDRYVEAFVARVQNQEYNLKHPEQDNHSPGLNRPLSSTKSQNLNYEPTPAPKKETTGLTDLRLFQQSLVTKIYSGRSTNGNDIITGQGYMDGGEGNDKIIGSASNDLIYGGAGDDVIIPGKGRDYIFGGAGNDIIDLRNSGVSTADGGTGIDTFILGKGFGSTIQGYNPKEDRIDARECGIGDLRINAGSISIIAYGERGGSSIACLEGTGYKLTGNLKTDCQNLGITANQIGY
jgi:hypothetical protein